MHNRSHVGTSGPGVRVNAALTLFTLGSALALSLFLSPWIASWGAAPAESRMSLPGDDLVPEPAYQTTRVVEIEATPDAIWPWLAQLGQDRAGFYSYDWLANLAGSDVLNGDRLVPAWQSRALGDFVPAVPESYAAGRTTERAGWRIGWLAPSRGLTLVGWGTFVLVPIDTGTTRLIVRTRTAAAATAIERLIDRAIARPLRFVMERRMLLGTLALCVPMIAATHDPRAAVVGCAATLTAVLGLFHVRRWWAVDAALVMLVLLVFLWARDAYLTLGWALLWLAPGAVFSALVFGVPRHRLANGVTLMPEESAGR